MITIVAMVIMAMTMIAQVSLVNPNSPTGQYAALGPAVAAAKRLYAAKRLQ